MPKTMRSACAGSKVPVNRGQKTPQISPARVQPTSVRLAMAQGTWSARRRIGTATGADGVGPEDSGRIQTIPSRLPDDDQHGGRDDEEDDLAHVRPPPRGDDHGVDEAEVGEGDEGAQDVGRERQQHDAGPHVGILPAGVRMGTLNSRGWRRSCRSGPETCVSRASVRSCRRRSCSRSCRSPRRRRSRSPAAARRSSRSSMAPTTGWW